MTFESLGLISSIRKSLTEQKISLPYPVQEESIPHILNRKDVMAIASTGSGKTAAYILPLLQMAEHAKALPNRHIRILTLVPTRELAMQVQEIFQLYGTNLSRHVKSMAVYGGVSINPQMIKMRDVEVLVATPGRLIELYDNGSLYLSQVSTLVMDEADKLLNMGFQKELNKIIALLPTGCQKLLFSATLSDKIENLKSIALHNPEHIEIKTEDKNINLIYQIAYSVKEERKGPLLRYLIKKHEMHQVIVFTSSIDKADKVVNKLMKNGVDARSIHSKQSQGARTDTMRKFKGGKLRVLVAIDLISRGIDIESLPYVINYELPRSPKDYLHRIGRTGRADTPGKAISFVTNNDEHHFKVIQKKINKWVGLEPTDDMDLLGY